MPRPVKSAERTSAPVLKRTLNVYQDCAFRVKRGVSSEYGVINPGWSLTQFRSKRNAFCTAEELNYF